jgi:transcriptional regulator with XRE-family HTH domain
MTAMDETTMAYGNPRLAMDGRRRDPLVERYSPGLNKRRLGRLLTRFRKEANLTLDDASQLLYLSRSGLNRLETGETKVNVHVLKSMLDLYEIGGDRWPALIEMALHAREKGWWHEFGPDDAGTYVDFETEVEEVRVFELATVHGLLQTADYARTLLRQHYQGRRDIEDLVARQIAVRMTRQERLTAEPPIKLQVVLDESVLLRPLGGPDIRTGQLAHLAEIGQLPNIGMRVLPLDHAHPGLTGAFSIMHFPKEMEEPDLIHHQYPFNELFLDNPDQVNKFHRLFKELWSEALRPEESMEVLRRHAEL